ncbi:hypothetical protein EHR01_01025 [Leptospira mtsangambouensis]|uniref:Lipoprotein n=1 Tax=Leptospira mtsangambouensis TaxID=2484912 RepID=A0ABY2P2S3_9LEPT|nr:hypothetical protein [Leptospira mtsangambouensis]TGM81417.1 hypothetical protein EHR01_01025 [Leptospira mtsangambouensis]
MRKLLIVFPILFVCCFSCSSNEENNLIPGTKLTGDPVADALVLAVLTNPPCFFLTTANANTPILLGEGQTSICSNQLVNGTVQVQKSGTYEVSGSSGRQTLSSSNCNSTRFDYHVFLKDGNTDLYSTGSGQTLTLSLEVGKSYSIQSTGLVDPSGYQCQGRPVSSSITPYRINLRKL